MNTHTRQETLPVPDFLQQLSEAFGWTRHEATVALGEWMLSTEAGRALRAASGNAGRVSTAA